MAQLYYTTIEHIEQLLAAEAEGPIHRWRCPCDDENCKGVVLYCRHRSSFGDMGFEFMATQTFQPEPPYPTFHVDNVEDLAAFLEDPHVPEGDRMMYALWFAAGLREAILSA